MRAYSKVILRIAGFLDFVHRPVFQKIENTTFRKLDLFPSSGEGGGGGKIPIKWGPLVIANHNPWRLALYKGPNRVGVSPPSPEDGNRSSFLNVVFSSF
jgi:hypothetical protein